MLRYLYSLIFYFAIFFILLRLLWRSRYNPAYRKRIAERFGWFKLSPGYQNGLWVHAVSLGEVIAATPLIKAIRQHYPDLPITLTTMTITGSERAQSIFAHDVFHVYVPYDIPLAVNNFLNRVRPRALVILETELWPNILAICQRKKIPVMLSNARLSARSAKLYQRIPTLTKEMLAMISILSTHGYTDAQRFIHLGMDPQRVFITGSIKFDLAAPASIFEEAQVLRNILGFARPILIAGSTHEGEEEKVLQAFKQILLKIPDTLLILVPRHPQRFARVTDYCQRQGYHVVTRLSQQVCSCVTQIFIGDTIGELKLFYAAADVAFVGGSLVAVGGHNLLEPLSLGVPTVVGPHMFNFTEINAMLLAAEAIFQVPDAEQLAWIVTKLLEDSTLRATVNERAQEVLEKNKGAVEKNLRLLATLLN